MNSISIKYRIPLLLLIVLAFTSFTTETINAQEYLRVYTSAPGSMTTNVTGVTVTTEDFTSFSVPPNNSNWAPLPGGFTSSIGTYYQTAGQSYVKPDDQYGAGTTTYMAIKVGGKVKLSLNTAVQYFGFAWPAGDGSNTIKVKRNGIVIGTFATSDIVALLPKDASNTITAINGSTYTTDQYYGKPGTGQNSNEPYAYLHFVASSGLAFDEIELSMGGGGEFENDNHSIVTGGAPVLQGDWVQLISIQTPVTVDDSKSGTSGQPVVVDVLANDSPGDAPIDPSTVHIDGTPTAGSSLTVAGEGVWSVNTTNGKITFTPEPTFTANPTPIQYMVNDDNGYSSNMSTVTITYVVGPTANDDSAITPLNTPVVINALLNDVAGSSAINAASMNFEAGTEPNPTTVGTFAITGSGVVTFTPVTGFLGVATIDYNVCDANGLCDRATITVNVLTGSTIYYPALGPGTLGFEDLWPSKGDYDFNDLVIDYQFKIETNYLNKIDKVTGTFTIKAFGAGYRNGFGFQLSSAINAADLSVSGYSLKENFITLDANGTEAGQSKPTIIVFDNTYKEMTHPGVGIGVNTDPGAPYVTPKTITIEINFTPNTYTLNNLDIGNFNPFIFINKWRPNEVHLPDYPPTDLANQGQFGIWDDDSNPSQGRYYKTENNLPWAINIYESFDYPKEKQPIINAYLKFAAWATSGGTLFPDWYKDLSGYRDDNYIYQVQP